MRTGRPVRRQRLAPCSSSVVLPLMPRWFDKVAAVAVVATAASAIGAALIIGA